MQGVKRGLLWEVNHLSLARNRQGFLGTRVYSLACGGWLRRRCFRVDRRPTRLRPFAETENRVRIVLGAQALDKCNCPKRCGCGISIFVANFSLFMFSFVPYFRVRPVLSRKITRQVDHILTLKPIALCTCYVCGQQLCQSYVKKKGFYEIWL